MQAINEMTEPNSISVHRCRFVDFAPSAITALAFPPLPLPSVKGKKNATIRKQLSFGVLAVGRANGNIELCEWTGLEYEQQAPQAWVAKKVSALSVFGVRGLSDDIFLVCIIQDVERTLCVESRFIGIHHT